MLAGDPARRASAGLKVPRAPPPAASPVRIATFRARALLGLLLLAAALLLIHLPGAHAAGLPAPDQPPASAAGYDSAMVAEVYAAALSFMAPRILDSVPVPQLTIWGLHGLTALDPRLDTSASEAELRLALDGKVLRALPAPAADNVAAWARVAADLAAVALPFSPAVQRAGTQGIMRNFFDEVFNHLDPYSRYEPPDAANEDRENRSGEAGAGLVLAVRGRDPVVTEVIPDGPAALIGVRAGDRIVAVDGQTTHGQKLRVVAGWLAGQDGTTVTLAWRARDGRIREADLIRALVPPETVFTQRVGDVLFVRITGFNRSTAAHLNEALQAAQTAVRPPAGLALDLRGNRGGLLLEAVAAADLFLDGGPIASTAGRDPEADHLFRASVKPSPPDLPVVVLVDGRTASSAEILAAALADRGRAVVAGSTTFGKGLVQTVASLPDGGELFVTWSRVIAPLGWPLQGLGVLPQVCTSGGQADVLQQLRTLEDGQAPMARAIETERASRAPVPPAQAVAIRSTCPAAEGRDLDAGVARWLIDHPAGYAAALLPPLREVAQ